MEYVEIRHLLLLQHKVGRIMRLRSGQHFEGVRYNMATSTFSGTHSHVAPLESLHLTLSLLLGQEFDGLVACVL